jgi:hypothetical protein
VSRACGVALALCFWFWPSLLGSSGSVGSAVAQAPAKSSASSRICVTKAGEATGITQAFAEYEALLIIRQVTGNWPIETDSIGPANYRCRQQSVGWTCKAQARVCKRP